MSLFSLFFICLNKSNLFSNMNIKSVIYFFLLVVNFAIGQDQNQIVEEVKNFPIPIFTDSNLSLVILGSAWTEVPNTGDELSIIDFDGNIDTDSHLDWTEECGEQGL